MSQKPVRWQIILGGRILNKLAEFWEVIGRVTLKNLGNSADEFTLVLFMVGPQTNLRSYDPDSN